MNVQQRLQKLLAKKFVRYIINGILTAAVEYSTFLLCFYIWHLQINVSNSISYIVAMVVNFLLLRLWVFQSNSQYVAVQISQYIALVAINFVISNILIFVFAGLGSAGFIAKASTMALIVMWNFVIMNKYIFNNKTNQKEKRK